MLRKGHNLQMVLVLGAVLLATVIICLSAANCSGGKLNFEKTYYLVYYRASDNAESADSLSQTVLSYGGAGYILNYKDKYYVSFSCYGKEDESQKVLSNLKNRDLECKVLKIEIKEFKLLTRNAKNNQNLYLGNLNTLDSLYAIAYECANGLDTGEYSQSTAKQMLSSITDTLKGLLRANENNCFTQGIKSLVEECEKVGGYLLSKNMRYIQIAIADKILHTELT